VKTQLLDETSDRRTYAVVLETGDEVMACLSAFAREADLDAAQITGIGAFSDASLQYFCWRTKKYVEIPVDRQVEVAALVGDVALSPKGDPSVHLHVVLGDKDGSAMAGHLGKAHVRPTLEIIVTESPAYLQKAFDPESGLALIRPQ
jgi:predicted DNA-binding protein with PD1-like motif